MKRRMSNTVVVGSVCIGGGNPIAIQTMTNTPTEHVSETLQQIHRLYAAGADLVRIAVPTIAAAKAFLEIRRQTSKPLIADIHFDYRLAIAAIEAGANKIRINPGNIGDWDKVNAIIVKAKEAGVAIRIGINAGSLEKDILTKYKRPTAEAMVASALAYEKRFLDADFHNYVLSLKSTNVNDMVEAYRLMAKKSQAPFHLGVTEAGTVWTGTIKSAIGIGALLLDGIGDTFRVSLTAQPDEEIRVAKRICRILGIRSQGVMVISCPTCGRTDFDLIHLAEEFEKHTAEVDKSCNVAIMGCVVNGPGEAKQADFGLAVGKGSGVIFRKGEPIRTVLEHEYLKALLQEVEKHG